MSILIKGMEMPANCFLCPLSVLNGERLFCKVTKEEVIRAKRSSCCPLVPVPSHGDLVDRNLLLDDFRQTVTECKKWKKEAKDSYVQVKAEHSEQAFVEAVLRVKNAPTIIPAEEGET